MSWVFRAGFYLNGRLSVWSCWVSSVLRLPTIQVRTDFGAQPTSFLTCLYIVISQSDGSWKGAPWDSTVQPPLLQAEPAGAPCPRSHQDRLSVSPEKTTPSPLWQPVPVLCYPHSEEVFLSYWWNFLCSGLGPLPDHYRKQCDPILLIPSVQIFVHTDKIPSQSFPGWAGPDLFSDSSQPSHAMSEAFHCGCLQG